MVLNLTLAFILGFVIGFIAGRTHKGKREQMDLKFTERD